MGGWWKPPNGADGWNSSRTGRGKQGGGIRFDDGFAIRIGGGGFAGVFADCSGNRHRIARRSAPPPARRGRCPPRRGLPRRGIGRRRAYSASEAPTTGGRIPRTPSDGEWRDAAGERQRPGEESPEPPRRARGGASGEMRGGGAPTTGGRIPRTPSEDAPGVRGRGPRSLARNCRFRGLLVESRACIWNSTRAGFASFSSPPRSAGGSRSFRASCRGRPGDNDRGKHPPNPLGATALPGAIPARAGAWSSLRRARRSRSSGAKYTLGIPSSRRATSF